MRFLDDFAAGFLVVVVVPVVVPADAFLGAAFLAVAEAFLVAAADDLAGFAVVAAAAVVAFLGGIVQDEEEVREGGREEVIGEVWVEVGKSGRKLRWARGAGKSSKLRSRKAENFRERRVIAKADEIDDGLIENR